MRGRTLGCLLSLVLFAACAISEPPPGGPEDKTPPSVSSTVPAEGASSVAFDAPIEITFNEKMSKTRFQRFVQFRPEITIAKVEWKGTTLVLLPDALHPDTTYLVELLPGFSDAHNVRAGELFRFAFATSAKIDTGQVSGRIFFRREPTAKATVRLFTLPKDTAFAAQATRPDREVGTNEKGEYRFGYLSNERVRYLVWAYEDGNGNGSYDPDNESGNVYADTLVLNAAVPVLPNTDIWIIDPTEPVEITGSVINTTGIDSIPVSVTMQAIGDTTETIHYRVCDPEGNYRFDNILRGSYTLWSFLDLSPDSLCGMFPCPTDTAQACAEPCIQYPDTIVVAPGDKRELEPLELGGEKGDE